MTVNLMRAVADLRGRNYMEPRKDTCATIVRQSMIRCMVNLEATVAKCKGHLELVSACTRIHTLDRLVL